MLEINKNNYSFVLGTQKAAFSATWPVQSLKDFLFPNFAPHILGCLV